jgi:hypothetical protein
MLPWDLEDWLTDEGDRVVRTKSAKHSLSDLDSTIYEIWLLDTEVRNGGLSQYFCNHGVAQWQQCVKLASLGHTPSFALFAEEVNAMIAGASDPYEAINSLGLAAENAWDKHSKSVVSDLRRACSGAL